MKHLLFVIGKLPDEGTCRYVVALAQGLARAGIQIEVVCGERKSLEAFSRARMPARFWRAITGGFPGWLCQKRLSAFMSECSAEIVHAHGAEAVYHAEWLARAGGVPCVATVYPPFRSDRRLRRMARVVCATESLREDLLNKVRLPREKIVHIPYGIESSEDVAAFPLGQATVPVIGMALSPAVACGVEVFLHAAGEVASSGADALFMVVGDMPKVDVMRKLARCLGVQKVVTFVSSVEETRPLIEEMDIYVHPATSDGGELLLLEAMAMGKAVVAFGVGEIYSIIQDNDTGRLIPKSDSHALAEAIINLLRNPSEARSIGRKARELVRERFPLTPAIEKTLSLYAATIAT